MSIVSFEKCDEYDYNTVYSIIEKQFALFNVKDKLFKGIRVAVKPNLLKPKAPKGHITTNPVIIKAICSWLKANGVENITVCDSPGGPYTKSALELIYGVCGLKIEGIEEYLNYDCSWVETKTAADYLERHYNIISPLAKADFIINVCKVKTHAMALMSCGIKNMFGAIPGLQKPELHCKYPEEEKFTQMLTELALTVTPNITVADGVYGLEGDGPANGIVRKCGYIITSDNVFELDKEVARFIGIPLNRLGTYNASCKYNCIGNITVVGEREKIKPFVLPKTVSINFVSAIPKPLQKAWVKVSAILLKPIPKINNTRCIGCGKCAESCPQNIITIENKRALINASDCISCFCCHEMCPVNAVIIKRAINM